MDLRSVVAFSSEAFGFRAASFLSALNHDHPDLRREPFASFFDEVFQTARCVSFCKENGLVSPLKAVCSSAPKSHTLFFAATRLLVPDARRRERCRKISLWSDFRGLKDDPLSLCPDLPDSFDRFGSSSLAGDSWSSMESSFLSAGCLAMAGAARAAAAEHVRDDLGLARLSMRRATLILGKRLGVWRSSRSVHPVAIPACLVRLPDWASAAISSSEVGLSGHPLFDHHVVVSFLERPSIPESLDRDMVVLGERDGVFHFLCSD